MGTGAETGLLQDMTPARAAAPLTSAFSLEAQAAASLPAPEADLVDTNAGTTLALADAPTGEFFEATPASPRKAASGAPEGNGAPDADRTEPLATLKPESGDTPVDAPAPGWMAALLVPAAALLDSSASPIKARSEQGRSPGMQEATATEGDLALRPGVPGLSVILEPASAAVAAQPLAGPGLAEVQAPAVDAAAAAPQPSAAAPQSPDHPAVRPSTPGVAEVASRPDVIVSPVAAPEVGGTDHLSTRTPPAAPPAETGPAPIAPEPPAQLVALALAAGAGKMAGRMQETGQASDAGRSPPDSGLNPALARHDSSLETSPAAETSVASTASPEAQEPVTQTIRPDLQTSVPAPQPRAVSPIQARQAEAMAGLSESAETSLSATGRTEGARGPHPSGLAAQSASADSPGDGAGGPALLQVDPLTPEETLARPVRSEADASGATAAPPSLAATGATPPPAAPAPVRANAATLAVLSEQMTRKLDGGSTRFDLELNPADLGRVDVRLDIDSTGSVRATFTFETPHAARELSRRSDELQKSLESAGFNLSGGLSFDVAGDRSQGRGATWADARDDRPAPPRATDREPAGQTAPVLADALRGRGGVSRSGVDIRI